MIVLLLSYIFSIKFLTVYAIIYLIYKYVKQNQNLHEKLGHEGPPPLPFFGNLLDVRKMGFHEFDRICRQKYGKLYPFYFGGNQMSVVSDEELLKQIMIKEFKCFTDRMELAFRSKRSQKMLTVLKGKDWERVRNLITPTFTSGKLRKMSPLISDGIDLLKKRISENPQDTPIDIKEFFGALTIDVIARTMFGMQIDSQTNPNNQFVMNAKKLFSFSFFNSFIIIFLIFPKLGYLFRKILPKWEFFGGGSFQFFIDNMQMAIDERAKSTDKYNDFLALMMKAHKKEIENDSESPKLMDSKTLSNDEIMAQSLVFLLAGYETTATTLTFVAYFLAKNPNAQQDLYNEIIESFGNEGEITNDILMTMPILDAVVCETLRICPPAVRVDRVCTQDVTLEASDNTKISFIKGDIVTIPIYAIHSDSAIWPDPEKFDYHRFDPDHKKINGPYSFMPFGMGPRNCVGMRFALLEVKWAIVNILQNFEIVPCEETLEKLTFKISGLLSPIKPILLKIVNREQV